MSVRREYMEPTDKDLRMWAIEQAIALGADEWNVEKRAERLILFVNGAPARNPVPGAAQ